MPELIGLSIQNVRCAPKVAGVKKVWLADCTRITIVVTQGLLKDEVSDYTVSNLDDLVAMEFTKNKTAFFNQVQSAVNGPVDYSLQFSYEALTAEIIYVLNIMRATCCFAAFVQLNNGLILAVGWDYDHDTEEITEIDVPLQFKGTINSGLGNNDATTSILEFVGQGKSFALSTSLTAADFDDTTGHD